MRVLSGADCTLVKRQRRGLIYLGHWIEFRSSINEQSIGTGPRGSLRNATGMDDAGQLHPPLRQQPKSPLDKDYAQQFVFGFDRWAESSVNKTHRRGETRGPGPVDEASSNDVKHLVFCLNASHDDGLVFGVKKWEVRLNGESAGERAKDQTPSRNIRSKY